MAKTVRDRVFLVDFLAVLFGISAWVEINGLWVEMPILVSKLPEFWELSSYVVIITQVANIGPIMYSTARRFWPNKVREVPAIHVSLFIGVACCIFLILFWSRTAVIGGEKHSVALLTLSFFLAFVDCTTSVLYLPFMANFREKYIISYLMGEGLSGLMPGVFALIQGASSGQRCRNNPETTTAAHWTTSSTAAFQQGPTTRFSVEAFFGILLTMMIISWISFCLLDKLPYVQSEKVLSRTAADSADAPPVAGPSGLLNNTNGREVAHSSTSLLPRRGISNTFFILLLFTQGYACSLSNGVLPSIQTYSTLPYGTHAYHLAVTLSSIANPLACLVAMFITITGIASVSVMTVVSTCCASYILLTALESPDPPLADRMVGKVLIVVAWVLFSGTLSYVKACTATILRCHGGHRALFWYGAASQVGSFIGAIATFSLVKYADIFHSC